MTIHERNATLLVIDQAADDVNSARELLSRDDITAEQGKAIMELLAVIFKAVADGQPQLTTKQAIDHAVWCIYNPIGPCERPIPTNH